MGPILFFFKGLISSIGPTLRGRGQTANRGQPTRQLAELKMINAGPTRYPPGNRSKAVDRRAKALAGEYRRDLAALDRRFHGTVC